MVTRMKTREKRTVQPSTTLRDEIGDSVRHVLVSNVGQSVSRRTLIGSLGLGRSSDSELKEFEKDSR